jgi:hypothetical protein
MVTAIDVKNFRGFEHFHVEGFAPINVIVGENAVGKTALLEAIWLTLATSPQKQLSLRQWRGHDIRFQRGSGDEVVDGIYGDIFHDPNSDEPVSIELWGRGYESRALRIEKTKGEIIVPLSQPEPPPANNEAEDDEPDEPSGQLVEFDEEEAVVIPISFAWRDEHGKERKVFVKMGPRGIKFEATGERLPNAFMFAAQVPVPSAEAGKHFSGLVKKREEALFVEVFKSIFPEIRSIAADTETQVLLADVPWAKQLLAMPSLSGGTNRAAAILLAIARRRNGCVMVDEVESGIYHARLDQHSRGLVRMAREYGTQLFLTSHSDEWLRIFVDATAEQNEDIAFWRMRRMEEGGQSKIRRMSYAEFRNGLAGGEMR